MLTSIALIFLFGLMSAWLMKKLGLPGLVGMLLTGIALGPDVLNLLDGTLLGISADLRQIALLIILTRAGLTLDLKDLKKVGRPAVLMCFVPACFELLGMVLAAPPLLGISRLEAAVMGSVVAAVSPAVIVPRMIRMIEEGRGQRHSLPQLILAGASVDDVFVIVVFTMFSSLAATGEGSALSLLQVPVSIALGLAAGLLLGRALSVLAKRFHIRDTEKLMILLALSFLLVALQNAAEGIVPFSGLLAVMGTGIALRKHYPVLADRLSTRYNKLWVAAETCLFVLVGAAVKLDYAVSAGPAAALCVLLALAFRVAGVLVCVAFTGFSRKEKLFCVISYLPKATVQAAIGAVPLSMGLACGDIVLTVAVLSILITAPVGAALIDRFAPRLLTDV